MKSEPVLFFVEIATIRASKYDLLLARLFGKKVVVTDSGCTVTMRVFRGKVYLTKCVSSGV